MKNKLNLFQILGLLLILLSFGLFSGRLLLEEYGCRKARQIADQIASILPEETAGSPEEYANIDMPVLSLNGQDFSGLLHVPAFGIRLPIASDWDSGAFSAYPRRFWGSVYDHSLILGGSDAKGQLDFCGKLDLGDTISVTDMTGARFTYEAARIDRRKQADMQTFLEQDSDLILFSRDSATLDYIIVRCAFVPFQK